MPEESKNLGVLTGFAIGGILAIVFVVAATIGAELYAPFKNWLADTFSHHWVGKGVLSTTIFFVTGTLLAFLLRRQSGAAAFLVIATWVAILGALSIIGFYVYEFFAHV